MVSLSHPRMPQLIIMLSGAVLLMVGVVLVSIQFGHEMMAGIPASPRALKGGKEGAELTTTYIGLMVTAIGAFLETVGYLATLPWRSN